MDIVFVPISIYSDVETMECEVCRLLRCSHGKCAAMHTEAFIDFRVGLLGTGTLGKKIYLPEGLVLQSHEAGVQFSWTYASIDCY